MANTHSLDLERGSSQYAEIADATQTGLDLSGDFSVEAWVNLEELAGGTEMAIVAKQESASARSYLFRITSDNKLNLEISSDGTTSNLWAETSDAAVITSGDVGNWVHLAGTFDLSTDTLILYKNAVVVASTLNKLGSPNQIFNNTAALAVGRDGRGFSYFDGKIAHVKMWSDIRTLAEVQSDQWEDPAVDASGLISWWKFDNDYTDENANGNDLTASGSPVFSTDAPWTTANFSLSEIEHCVDDDTVALWHMNGTAASAAKKDNAEGTAALDLTEVNTPTAVTGFDGEANGAYHLDLASSEYLSVANNAALNFTTDFTFEMWINIDQLPSTAGTLFWLIDKHDGTTGYFLYLNSDDTLKVGYEGTGTDTVIETDAAFVVSGDIGNWVYLAVSVDVSAQTATIAKNGVSLANTTSASGSTDLGTTTNALNIGRDLSTTSRFFDGDIDEVVISTRLKSAEEIAKYYSGTVSAKYYPAAGANSPVDGQLNSATSNSNWSTKRDGSGSSVDVSGTTSVIGYLRSTTTTDQYNLMIRGMFLFDPSTLPDSGIEINNAKLSFYATTILNPTAFGGLSVSVVSASPANDNNLVTADYGIANFGSTKFITDTAFTEFTASQYNDLTLNASGLAHIDTTGLTRFGALTAEEVDNSTPTWTSNVSSYVIVTTADGTNKPYLWVEYSAVEAGATDNSVLFGINF